MSIFDCRLREIVNRQSSIVNPQGFTLVELLVVVVIFGGIMGALLISFLTGQSTYFSADAYIQVQQEARRGLDTMIREMRETRATAGQQRYYCVPTADCSVASNTIVFQVPTDVDGDGDVIDGTGAVEWGAGVEGGVNLLGCIRYTLGPGPNGTQQIQRSRFANAVVAGGQLTSCNTATGTMRVLANTVTVLTFTFLPPRGLAIAVTAQQNAQVTGGQRPLLMAINGRVQFRN